MIKKGKESTLFSHRASWAPSLERKSLMVIVVVFGFFLGAHSSFAVDEGVIKGGVMNLTGGSKAVAGQEVVLHRLNQETEDLTLEAVTDAQGNFEFNGLVTASYYKYYLTSHYGGADYFSERVGFTENETVRDVRLNVYDTTTSDKDISVDIDHILVDVGDGLMVVNEIMVVRNSGDRAYIGSKEIEPGKKETIRFSLPPGATELRLNEGLEKGAIVRTPDGFSYTSAVPPGMRNMTYVYQLSFDSRQFNFSRRLLYKTEKLFLLVLNTKAKVDIRGLQAQGLVTLDNRRYWSFKGEKLKSGDTFRLSFTDLRSGNSSPLLMWAAVVAMLGVVGTLASYSLLRGRLGRKETVRESEIDPQEPLRQERKDLLTAIAQLDDRYEAGAVSEEAYHREREKHKNRLVEVIQELRGQHVGEQSET